MNIGECVEKRFLLKIESDKKLVHKELKEADYDFKKAQKSFKEEDFKWAIVKGYYAMFHAARAVLFDLGFREKRHFAIGVVLEDLNKRGKLESRFVNDFNAGVQTREDADYHYVYSKEIAENSLIIADEFVHRMKELLNVKGYRTTLFIGRFQPFHNGHLYDIRNALKFSDNIIIGVGSSQEKNTKENPFSYEERKEMMEKVIKKENLAGIEIKAVPDINDDNQWAEHVISITGKVDIVYTGNRWVKKLFLKKGFIIKDIILLPKVNATEIRGRIDKGRDWQELVPREIEEYIKKIDGVNRIKGINGKL